MRSAMSAVILVTPRLHASKSATSNLWTAMSVSLVLRSMVAWRVTGPGSGIESL